jgi:hypothetical protein
LSAVARCAKQNKTSYTPPTEAEVAAELEAAPGLSSADAWARHQARAESTHAARAAAFGSLLGHAVGGDAVALAVGKTSEFIGGVVDVVGNTGRTLLSNLRRKPKGGNKMV